ncbi:MAG TPA: efflux RND transporter periplasmic adaptor subunit [Candidatus Polarisedimenticolia bacterium]|jgi:HlyD family secretion protein
MTRRRKRVIAAVVAVGVLGGVVAYNVYARNNSQVAVQTQKAGRRELVSVVSASGEIKPKRYVNISANVSGRIEQLLIKEGDTVRKGQVLARIDSTRIAAGERQSAAALEGAKADLARAQADLEVSRLGFERQKKMHADRLVSDQAFEQADAELKMKTAAVEAQRKRITQGEALLASNRDDLEKTSVVAPMDGVVTSLPKEEGETVIGAQSFSPTVIMTVADLSVMEVEIMVDETDIRNVRVGQPAEVRVDALEGIKIKGDVTEIGSSAIPRGLTTQQASSTNTANQAKDFKVEVTLKDPPPTLRPGLNATADITTARKDGVLAIPIQAVVVREISKQGKVMDPAAVQASESDPGAPPEKGQEKEGVFVVVAGKATFRPVKTGIIGETEIEIGDGLKEGEEVVTGSYKTLRTLKDQAKVKLEVKKPR